jgi:hypothetical protein
MHECIMIEEIHESIYDYCEKIYETICYNNNNCNDDVEFLKTDLNNFIENEIENMTQYDINNILLSYGIDNAYNAYNAYKKNFKNNRYDEDKDEGVSKLMVKNLISSSFIII